MGLFHRRPLCFFCMLFLVTSALVSLAPYEMNIKLITLLSLVVLTVMTALIALLAKKVRIQAVAVTLCLVAVVMGVANSTLRIDYKRQKAEELVGNRKISATVLDTEYVSDSSSAYTVRIEKMSGKKTSIKAVLLFGFECGLDVGDVVSADASVMSMSDKALGRSGADVTRDKDTLLMAVVYDPDDGAVNLFDREMKWYRLPFVKNGFSVMVDMAKDAIKDRAYTLVGEQTGSVLNGYLLGDTSDVPTNVIRDFRRSGVSHLFAVSGLHISVLLGAVEILLRKLLVHKYARCGIISLLAGVLLVLTGFSMSAMRAVLMLWIVYVIFVLSEEADPPTTLFVSISIILLIFPFAVYELGMWMSFLATLGLVTVYPIIDEKIQKKKEGKAVYKFMYSVGRAAILVGIMTVISNMFLLPIQWAIFGELSLVAIPTNILLSPLSTVMLISSVICLILGGIPFVGKIICLTVEGTCKLTLLIVEFFSSLDFATVSLEYAFVAPMVIIFTATMITVIAVKLKRKWLVALPACGFALAFTVGVVLFNVICPTGITYYGKGKNELLSLTDKGSLCVVDMSNGAYDGFVSMIHEAKPKGATDVDILVFTTVTQRHISSMDYYFRSQMVHEIYIPRPGNDTQLESAYALAMLAEECGVRARLYDSGDIVTLGKSELLVKRTQDSTSVFVKGREKLFGYTDAFADAQGLNTLLSECDTVLIGNNGVPDVAYRYSVSPDATLIYSSEELAKRSAIVSEERKTYVNTYDKIIIAIKFK